MSVVSVMRCQVESLVQRSRTECGASLCVCVCVFFFSRNLVNAEALAHRGL
jgi:hypothetical protein